MRRLRRHPEKRSVFFKIIVVVAFLVTFGLGLSVYLVFFTGTCGIETVRVSGNNQLTADYVRVLSGVDDYKNLVTLPVGRIKENVERDPWVKNAEVGRELFHTVKITITERSPIALLNCEGAGFLVDDTGHVISSASVGEYQDLPHIHGGDIPIPEVDTPVDNDRIMECVRIMGRMHDSVRLSLSLANPFDGRGQVFISRTGYHVIYGTGSETDRKNEILQAIMVEIDNSGRDVAYVDVRVADSPVIKPL